MTVTNPGDKEYLKQVFQTQEITVDDETITESVEVGAVVRAIPGPVVPGDEYIALLVTREGSGQWRWNAPLDDYDPNTVDDDPANEPRWVAV